MADPLSVAASIIAVIGAVDGVVKTFSCVKKIRHAPDKVLSLHNEISDFRLVLGYMERYFIYDSNRPPVSHDHEETLVTLITNAKDQILELDNLLQYRILKPESTAGTIKISRLEWTRAESTMRHFC